MKTAPVPDDPAERTKPFERRLEVGAAIAPPSARPAMSLTRPRPEWLCFDGYGTLVQWDEGMVAAARCILRSKGASEGDAAALSASYRRHQRSLEQSSPQVRPFLTVARQGLRLALGERGLPSSRDDVGMLTDGSARKRRPGSVPTGLQARPGRGLAPGPWCKGIDRHHRPMAGLPAL